MVAGTGVRGCEFMTGGRMICLGRTGRNFAAGMSGGFAYVLDDDNRFRRRCNPSMVDLEQMDLEDEDAVWLKQIISTHYEQTTSHRAAEILADWDTQLQRFVRVFPHEYRRVLTEQAAKAELEKETAHG